MPPVRTGMALAISLAGMAPAAVAQTIPASASSIEAKMEPSGGPDGTRLIYVTNRSSQTIIVTSVRLTDCENIAGGCGVRRTNFKILPGRRTMVLAVRARDTGASSFVRYGYTWEIEREEGPSPRDIAKDSTALTVDTVIVRPVLVEIKEGETVDLRQVLSITAWNAAGQPLPRFFFYTELTLGAEYVALRGGKLVGKAAGTGAFVVWASMLADPNAPRKGAVEVLVRVTPP